MILVYEAAFPAPPNQAADTRPDVYRRALDGVACGQEPGPKAIPRTGSALSAHRVHFSVIIPRKTGVRSPMNMQTAVNTVLGKYATFSGRSPRSEYWWWMLALILLMLVLGVIDGALLAPIMGYERFSPEAGQPISLLVSLALLLPSLAVSVRRLHDIDRSGWWYLLSLIPVIGTLVLLYWYLQPGTSGDNQFGPEPLR